MRRSIRQMRAFDNPYYYDFNYRKARTATFKRDKYKCVYCGTKKLLTVHHLKPKSTHPLNVCEVRNMVTLCQKHHTKAHQDWDDWKENVSINKKGFVYAVSKTEKEVLKCQ